MSEMSPESPPNGPIRVTISAAADGGPVLMECAVCGPVEVSTLPPRIAAAHHLSSVHGCNNVVDDPRNPS